MYGLFALGMGGTSRSQSKTTFQKYLSSSSSSTKKKVVSISSHREQGFEKGIVAKEAEVRPVSPPPELLDRSEIEGMQAEDLLKEVATVLKERYNLDLYSMDRKTLSTTLKRRLKSSDPSFLRVISIRSIAAAMTMLLLRSGFTQVAINVIIPRILRIMCDIGYIIKDHVTALMQLLTVELREYNMQLVTTKCLNTAVMMMYLLLGKEHALQATRHCDVPEVVSRHGDPSTAPIDRSTVIRRLKDELLLRPKTKPGVVAERALYYVMITDGAMCRSVVPPPLAPNNNNNNMVNENQEKRMHDRVVLQPPPPQTQNGQPNSSRNSRNSSHAANATTTQNVNSSRSTVATRSDSWAAVSSAQSSSATPPQVVMRGGAAKEKCGPGTQACPGFPGHVFVLEKLPRGTFNIYQSYIYHYDLSEYINAVKSLSVSYKRMTSLLDGLVHVLSTDVWDKESTQAWMKFTNTPYDHSRKWEGCTRGTNTMLPCVVKVRTDACVSSLATLVNRTLAKLQAVPQDQRAKLYGEPTMFPPADAERGDAPRPAPLSIAQMISELTKLSDKLPSGGVTPSTPPPWR